MFASLKGTIFKPPSLDSQSIILDNQGVGYQVYVSQSELANLPLGEKTTLYIHTHVRAEEITLFGFADYDNLNMFKLLLSVSGVGPKTALNIFNAGTSSQITTAITQADVKFFTQVSGLGKKGAQRIIIDLGSKLKSLKSKELDLVTDKELDPVAIQALVNLGYLKRDVVKAMLALNVDSTDSGELVKLTLKELNS